MSTMPKIVIPYNVVIAYNLQVLRSNDTLTKDEAMADDSFKRDLGVTTQAIRDLGHIVGGNTLSSSVGKDVMKYEHILAAAAAMVRRGA